MKTILLTLFTSLILLWPVQAQSIVGNWKLTDLQLGTEDSQTIDVPVTLNISRENKIGGNGGCNSYGGSYFLKKNNRVLFKDILSTKMYCQATAELENSFFRGLLEAQTAKIKNGKLFIQNKDKNITLIFVKNK